MEIQIPSPSVFLNNSPVLKPIPNSPIKQPVKPKSNGFNKTQSKAASAASTVQDGAITKPKQSKSRNGCLTCKKKRLKCDETKPTCAQCAKRGAECEGYKKDFKWRSFEETTFNPRPTARAKKSSRSFSFTPHEARKNLQVYNDQPHSANGPLPSSWSPGLSSAFASATYAFGEQPTSEMGNNKQRIQQQEQPPAIASDGSQPFLPESPDFDDGLDSRGPPNTATRASSVGEGRSARSAGSTLSDGSSNLLDLFLAGSDTNKPPDHEEELPVLGPTPYQPMSLESPIPFEEKVEEEDYDEEVFRQPLTPEGTVNPAKTNHWTFRQPSPAPSDASSSSSRSSNLTIVGQPSMEPSSSEMLMLRFDQETCGILSVKDGRTENPWRTLIWPLARDSPALFHAISSMTAFHGAHEVPNLRVAGMAHMTKSIKKLAAEMANMRIDSALATTLTLAFSEGWDRHISTGIQHLRGAKIMVNNALVKHRRDMESGILTTDDALRLRFLCNTFIYMDVIARLTSPEEADELNLEEIILTANQPFSDMNEVDPLMGCAITLFPLIGRVANLIQRIRRTETNSLAVVSQAMELKEQLQQWTVPPAAFFERPEDVSSEVQHSIQTAEAYRYATLLYLHQAVPEIPSLPSETLAKKVLVNVASVPLSSRAIIIQIFPLLAAGCEMTDLEDRSWVMARWLAMIQRLRIGNVDSCLSVVQEVWGRRDLYEAQKAERLNRRHLGRSVASSDFVPPSTKSGRRKARSKAPSTEDDFSASLDTDELTEQNSRSMKRSVTFDTLPARHDMGTMPIPVPGTPGSSRRGTDIVTDQLEFEYTVRGRLHWLGVMKEWDWEGELVLSFSILLPGFWRRLLQGHSLTRCVFHAAQYFLDDGVLLVAVDGLIPLDNWALALALADFGALGSWVDAVDGKSLQANSGDASLLLLLSLSERAR